MGKQVAHTQPARHVTLGAASKLLLGMDNGGRETSNSTCQDHKHICKTKQNQRTPCHTYINNDDDHPNIGEGTPAVLESSRLSRGIDHPL